MPPEISREERVADNARFDTLTWLVAVKIGRRALTLHASASAALQQQHHRQAFERMLAGERWRDWSLAFFAIIGPPLEPSNVVGRPHELLAHPGLPRQRFHDFRHCCATSLLAQGVPACVVQDVLGHSQVSLTLDTYSHVMPGMLREAAEAKGRALG